MPILYIIGARDVTKNLLKTLNTPDIILLIPKIIGLKNIILVKLTVAANFSPEKPGTIKKRICGTRIIIKTVIIVKNNKNEFKRLERKSQASLCDLTKYSEKSGIMAAEIEPIIKTMATKSGIRKAA